MGGWIDIAQEIGKVQRSASTLCGYEKKGLLSGFESWEWEMILREWGWERCLFQETDLGKGKEG